jgi:DNA-binding NarL/FixJ family response regulator
MNRQEHDITIALTDDHIVLRNALAALIDRFPGFRVLFLAGNGKEMTEQVAEKGAPDILILDLSMPVMDGYQCAEWLKTNYPDVAVLVLTMFEADLSLIRLLQLGVKGFVRKDIHPDELKTALHSLVKEGYYYPVQTVGRMANLFQLNRQNQSNLEANMLAPREIRFLQLACTDATYTQIAADLNISPKSVDALRDQLFTRFNVKNRVGLAMYAVRNGVVRI